MIIKYPMLAAALKKRCAPVYIISGQEPYLVQQAASQIKQAWQHDTQQDTEETTLTVQHAADWAICFEEANSYALFTTHRLLDIRFDKKSLDADSKQRITSYLEQPNPRCLVLIQAPLLPAKTLQTLAQHDNFVHVSIAAINTQGLKQFIGDAFRKHGMAYEPQVPELIFRYNQNNLLACNQIIEQLALIHEPPQPITCTMVMDYLRDQGDFSIYELGDALLAGQTTQAIRMLRQLIQSQEEPTLILWLLAQEIRKLIQLHHLSQQALPFHTACQQLNIWTQKMESYQKATQRLPLKTLFSLLQHCQSIDEQLKSNRQSTLWHTIERLCLTLATG